jgi:RNA polymerase sigma factor (sigma-70 family)
MTDDAELLRRYAEQGSEAAFTELVRRHLDLVYGAALRRTGGDAHHAADIAQQVFTTTARQARKLTRHPVFSAWLHTATRNAALNLMISDRRRRARETEAVARAALDVGGNAITWPDVGPLIDAAIDELPESDRAVVVLRFLERRAFAEIGAQLRVSEDAARVRAGRALDKLRAVLARRGITSSAAALGAMVSTHPAVAAPAGLAGSIAAQSLANAAPVVVASLISAMTAKTITLGAAGAILLLAVGYFVGAGRTPDVATAPVTAAAGDNVRAAQLALLRQENERLRADLGSLQNDVTRLSDLNAKLEQRAVSAAKAEPPPTLAIGMSRAEVQQAVLNNLRQIAAAREQYVLENQRSPGRVQELIGRMAYIKRITTVDGEDYANVPMNSNQSMTVRTPGGIEVTYDPSGAMTTKPEFTADELQQRALDERMKLVQPSAQKAFEAYRTAHGGERPPNQQAIIPYFATPKEGADFVEVLEAQKNAKR